MRINNLALSFTVEDVPAAADFYAEHFGFRPTVSVGSFAKLAHDDTELELCFMQRGSEVLPEGTRDRQADGVIVAFVVQDAGAEEAWLREARVPITVPLQDEEWGERLFQVRDPNGIAVQLVEWVNEEGG